MIEECKSFKLCLKPLNYRNKLSIMKWWNWKGNVIILPPFWYVSVDHLLGIIICFRQVCIFSISYKSFIDIFYYILPWGVVISYFKTQVWSQTTKLNLFNEHAFIICILNRFEKPLLIPSVAIITVREATLEFLSCSCLKRLQSSTAARAELCRNVALKIIILRRKEFFNNFMHFVDYARKEKKSFISVKPYTNNMLQPLLKYSVTKKNDV